MNPIATFLSDGRGPADVHFAGFAAANKANQFVAAGYDVRPVPGHEGIVAYRARTTEDFANCRLLPADLLGSLRGVQLAAYAKDPRHPEPAAIMRDVDWDAAELLPTDPVDGMHRLVQNEAIRLQVPRVPCVVKFATEQHGGIDGIGENAHARIEGDAFRFTQEVIDAMAQLGFEWIPMPPTPRLMEYWAVGI